MSDLDERQEQALCENCGHPVDECQCVCPYCGERDACTCCVGYECATGG